MSVGGPVGRGEQWHSVWTDRDDDRADWNGFEACFESVDAYADWTKWIASTIVRELGITRRDHVVDLGCGTGRIASLVADDAGQVTALDYSETVLRIAQERRPRDNISYRHADLNTFDVAALGADKAYAVGSLLYLDSIAVVLRLITTFVRDHGGFAAMDLPDVTIRDDMPRAYDTTTYTHLAFDVNTLTEHFPEGRVVRYDTMKYAHADRRFNFVIAGATDRDAASHDR
jgi:ubiquinone/menaquinone biosynthesis C-methylase UbiE